MEATLPKWIHDRADHIRSKNSGMPKSQSFAIATQQAYAAGKAPKWYGTSEGRSGARKKYDSPKSDYKKTAKPSSKSKAAGISLGLLLGFSDELQKISAVATGTSNVTKASTPSSSGKLPKAVSVPREPLQKSPVQDHLSSAKSNPPHPVITGGI